MLIVMINKDSKFVDFKVNLSFDHLIIEVIKTTIIKIRNGIVNNSFKAPMITMLSSFKSFTIFNKIKYINVEKLPYNNSLFEVKIFIINLFIVGLIRNTAI